MNKGISMKMKHGFICLSLFIMLLLVTGCGPTDEIFVGCRAESLIRAINMANDSPATTTTLRLDPDCTYELTSVYVTDGPHPGAGLPAVTSAIIIDGQSATIRRSGAAGTPDFRFFNVEEPGSLTLNNLALTGGERRNVRGSAGAVLNYGTLLLNNCDVHDNHARHGAAIYNIGTFQSLMSTFHDNSADEEGGALTNFNGIAHIVNSTFSENQAGSFGGAIYNISYDGSTQIRIYDSSFHDNDGQLGGAFYTDSVSEITIHDSIFHSNAAETSGGAIHARDISGEMSILRSAL